MEGGRRDRGWGMESGEGGEKEDVSLIEGASSACIWANGRDGVGEAVEEGDYSIHIVSP